MPDIVLQPSQLVGKALGAGNSFSLRSAFAGGLTSVATAGIGAAMSGYGGALLSRGAKGAITGVNWGNVGVAAGRAALSYTASYAANKIAGVQTSFSWSGVAAQAVGAVAGGMLSEAVGGSVNEAGKTVGGWMKGADKFTRGAVAGFSAGVASHAASRLLNKGGKLDYSQIAVDAFANALAGSFVAEISKADLQNRTDKAIENLPIEPSVIDIVESNPQLMQMRQNVIDSGQSLERFYDFVKDDKIRNSLLRANAGAQISEQQRKDGTNINDIMRGSNSSKANLDNTIYVGENNLSVTYTESFGMDLLQGIGGVVEKYGPVADEYPIEDTLMTAKAAIFGPASVLAEKAFEWVLDYALGDQIQEGVRSAQYGLTAYIHNGKSDDIRWLTENNSALQDEKALWKKMGQGEFKGDILSGSMYFEQDESYDLFEHQKIDKTAETSATISTAAKGAIGLIALGLMVAGAKEGIDLIKAASMKKQIVGVYTGKVKIDSNSIPDSVVDKILSTKKPHRPPPSTYLSKDYLDAHADMFSGGVARIQPTAPDGKIGRTETWVMPENVANEAIAKAGGDPRKLEQLLGLDKGYLGDNPILVEIPNPTGYKMPTGNEFAAYDDYWRPGGFTHPGGLPEAIINPVLPDNYTFKPAFKR